jgi:hypothetical protein
MKRTISGPGASDFLTAGGGEDLPGSGARGTAELREESPVTSARNLIPQLAPEGETADAETPSGKPHTHEDDLHGSQTGNVGGGGPNADRPNPART